MSKKKQKSSVLTDSDVAIVPQEPEFPVDPIETLTPTGTEFIFGHAAKPNKGGRSKVLAYPIDKLTPDSEEYFDVPTASSKVKAVTSSIRTFAYRNGFAVSVRYVPGAVRVWRNSEKRVHTSKQATV
jgi:hypothetical protein